MRTRVFTEAAAAVALGTILGLIKIPLPHLVFGGSVSLETLPILVIACRHGWRHGLLAGVGLGATNFLLQPVFVHPIQVILDYPAAFGGLGAAAGLFTQRVDPALADRRRRRWRILAAVLAGNGVRLLAAFVSGVVFFAAYAPEGQSVWIYSLAYNASYIGPQAALHLVLSPLLSRLADLHR